MVESAVQRHLAAILAADVVGFSRLAEADEDRTLARLRALRSDLIDPTIAVHNGRVVKRTGDGAIVEFRSVVDAVRCAVEVQNAMAERNAGIPPERRIEFRIGIHLGDVVEESDGDLMGEGVNIAARLEGVADPGAICLSEDAYRQVRSRLEHTVRDLGETKLKNISAPMRVYSLTPGLKESGVPPPDTPQISQAPRRPGPGLVVAALAALAVIGATLAFRALRPVAPEAAYEACVEQHFAATPRPATGVFLIAVTPLRGDEDRTHFNQIGRTMSRLYGEDLDSAIQIEMIDCPPILPQGGNVAQTVAAGRERGIAVLKKANADVLIWGDVVRPGSQIEVRFLSSTDEVQSDFTADAIVLDADFGEAMGGLIAAKALTLAEVSSEDMGGYLVPTMERALAITSPLVAVMPSGLTADQRGTILKAHADALFYIGFQAGDNAQLEASVMSYEAALAERSRDRVPLDWAATQNGLGKVLMILGSQEIGKRRLEESANAFRAALTEWTRESAPLDWARSQNNLGTTLRLIGIREAGTKLLEDAVAAHQAALTVWTRERVPLDWASAQNNLGNALMELGFREAGTERFDAAVVAFQAALTEWTRDRVPLDWARVQTNLGWAYTQLGWRKTGTEQFEAAVVAYQAALAERTRERVPLDWASTQNDLGNALMGLGLREEGTGRIEEAVAAFHAALTEWTRERVPVDWATGHANLGWAFKELGRREGSKAHFEAAVVAYQSALMERTHELAPLDWAWTQHDLGNVLVSLGEIEGGTERFETAIPAFEAALLEITLETDPYGWAQLQNNLGNALMYLGEREGGTAKLEAAVDAFNAALTVWTRSSDPVGWAFLQSNLGFALAILGERESGTETLQAAVAASEAALGERNRDQVPFDWAVTQLHLGIAKIALFDKTADIAQLDQAEAHLSDAREVFVEFGDKLYLGMADARIAGIVDRRN